MDALTYDLMQMLKTNEDGSFTTRANRKHMLKMCARQIRGGGFKLPSAGPRRDSNASPHHPRRDIGHLAGGGCSFVVARR